MFQICAENGVDNREMTSLLPSSSYSAFSASCTGKLEKWLGLHGSWEGTQLGQLTPSDIPDLMTSCSVYKVGEIRRKSGAFRLFVVFSSHCHT